MKIRDIEVKFDFLDADDVEKFEKEARNVQEECKLKDKQKMSHSEAIRQECIIIENFFDNVFEKGISEKMFKGKKNLMDHIKAFEDIVSQKNEQQKGLENTLNRYQPNGEQRRQNKYHKGNRK